jgi:hypothetical protein
MRGICSRFGANYPLAILAIQDIGHGHPGSRRTVPLGLEMNLCRSLVLPKVDRSHAHVHGQQIGPLREVVHHSLAHGVLVLNVLLAAK